MLTSLTEFQGNQEDMMGNIKVLVPQLLQERGVKPIQLVREAHLAPGTAYKLADESQSQNQGSITFDVLARLCAFFDVEVKDLLEYVPSEK